MPTRIPVCIADKPFPSLNQARIHYRNILHRYQPGQSVNEEDRQDVEQLMTSSGVDLSINAGSRDIRVVQGHYGRTCFARCGADDSPKVISIMRSVKQCIANHGTLSESQVGVPSAEPALNADASTVGKGNMSQRTRKTKATSDIHGSR